MFKGVVISEIENNKGIIRNRSQKTNNKMTKRKRDT
jgi:hypothetical protein